MTPELLALRLLAMIPTALGAWALVALACGALRIRHPRLRTTLCLLAIVDSVLSLFGWACWSFVLLRVEATPARMAAATPEWIWTVPAAWAVIALALLTLRAARASRMHRVLAVLGVTHPAPPDVLDEVARAALHMGVRMPRTLLVPSDGTPFVAGLRRPVLVLPRVFWDRLDPAARRATLLHELLHVRARDGLRVLVAGLLADVFFFNWPLRRLLARWCREGEALTDHEAMHRGASRKGLARSLVESFRAPCAPRLGLAMGGGPPASAVRRLDLVRRPPGRRALLIHAAVLLLLFPWGLPGSGGSNICTLPPEPDRPGRLIVGLAWGDNPFTAPLFARLLPPLY